MLKPSPFKLYLGIRGVFTKLEFNGAVKQWSALPNDWDRLERRTSRIWYRVLQTIWNIVSQVGPIVGALLLAVTLVGRWFGASLFTGTLGSWSTWTILISFIVAIGLSVFGVVYVQLILYRDYDPDGVGGSIMRMLRSENKVSRWAVRIGFTILLYSTVVVSWLLLSLALAVLLGWLTATLLSAAIFTWQIVAASNSRDTITGQRINRFAGFVTLKYLEERQLKVAL